jgi:hypothetical protein
LVFKATVSSCGNKDSEVRLHNPRRTVKGPQRLCLKLPKRQMGGVPGRRCASGAPEKDIDE